MADRQKIEELQQKVNDVSARYEMGFAGRARATRNLDELDALIKDLDDMIAQGPSLMNGDNAGLRSALDTAEENVTMYRKEREEIARAKAEGPEAILGAELATWANCVFDEYARHYAGKSRNTRDLGRLEEMVSELEGIRDDMLKVLHRKEMASVREDLKIVESNMEMYKDELRNIREARDAGTRDDIAGGLANAANEQFAIYNSLFAGKGRTTRRPGLLRRMIENLSDIFEDMGDLNSKGLRNQANVKNIQIVRQNMEMYKAELKEIEAARDTTSTEDLANMLGGAANDVMADYREHFAGMDRATRNLDMLSFLCDEMYELALQMRQIRQKDPSLEFNANNLSIVLNNLHLYQAEYGRVKEAKAI